MTSTPQRLVPVILSGGAGTRLWPASRHDRPKQFLPLVKGKTTFSNTLARISNAEMYTPPIVVTSRSFGFLVATELRLAGMGGRIVMEPLRRDSAPAIAVAAVLAGQANPGSLMLVLAADHVVTDAVAFNEVVAAGLAAASAGHIVTFGIRPDRPSPNYGYIEAADNVDAHVRIVKRFIEKPDAARAQILIDQGCLWNSGNFLFRCDVLLAELARFEPDILAAAEASVASSRCESAQGFVFQSLDEASFATSPAKSIDYAVMERTSHAAVIPANYGWSDLGSFEALWEILDKDAHGNVVSGEAVLHKSSNSYVSSDGLFTAVIGLDNVAVVATRDAVLVAPLGVAADVKSVVADLEAAEPFRHLAMRHSNSQQPWGSERLLLKTAVSRVSYLYVNAGASLELAGNVENISLVTVVRGEATLTRNGVTGRLLRGATVNLSAGEHVGIANAIDEPLELVKLQITHLEKPVAG